MFGVYEKVRRDSRPTPRPLFTSWCTTPGLLDAYRVRVKVSHGEPNDHDSVRTKKP